MPFTTDSITHTWPIVTLRLDGKVDNKSDFNRYLEEWSEFYVMSSQRNEKFKLIYDARGIKSRPPLKYLYAQAEFLKTAKELTETWMDRTAIIVSSPIIKKMIHFVFNFYTPVRPFRVFLEHEEADMYQWINSQESGEEVTDTGPITEEELEQF